MNRERDEEREEDREEGRRDRVFAEMFEAIGRKLDLILIAVGAEAQEVEEMAKTTLEALAEIDKKADEANARVQATLADLTAEIAALKKGGTLTAEEQAALAALETKVDAIDPTTPTTAPPAAPPLG